MKNIFTKIRKFSTELFSLKLSKISASLLVALMVLFLGNSKFFLYKINNLFSDNFYYPELLRIIFEFTLHGFLIFLFFLAVSFNKILFNISALIIFVLTALFAYIYNNFGILIDEAMIANALDNVGDFNKITDYFSIAVYALFFLALPLYLVFKIQIISNSNSKKYYYLLVLFLLFFGVLSALNHAQRKNMIVAYSPIDFIDSIRRYYQELHDISKYKNNLIKISTIINDAKPDKNKISNLKVVLIIGESARSMNFSINGYKRETTPRLEKIKNLISFSDVTPYANLTNNSVAFMLSGKNEKEFSMTKNNGETIIKLFENLSFKTAWFSNQKAVGDDNVLLMIGTEAQKYIFKDIIAKNIGSKMIYDEYLLNYLSQEISDQNDEFIVLHTEGSHFLFDERYPDNFKIFTPTCTNKNPKKCSRESIVNSYDNSILYTDYFISKVIDKLKNENAILIYVSDHGQFLGEEGIYYHGSFGSQNSPFHKVPMFLWMSDNVLKSDYYKNKFNHALSKKDQKLSHNNLFDSLLDCSGVDSKLFDRNLSFCMPN